MGTNEFFFKILKMDQNVGSITSKKLFDAKRSINELKKENQRVVNFVFTILTRKPSSLRTFFSLLFFVQIN